MAFDTIIRGGAVATASDTFACDIGIKGGVIAALGTDLGSATEIVDATGKLVLPGGIDSHVHLAQPSGPGIVMADDFESGTRAAAFGGNTMVLPFAMQQKGESLREVVKQYHAKADGNCYVDVSFHLIIADATDRVLGQELPALVEDGYTSFKVFMTYEGLALSDLEMLNVMSVARETGALVMVHAENYDAIRFLTDRLERAGKTAPRYHATSRPIPVEREATHRAISLAELVDVPIVIVHVSNGEAMEEIRRAQQRGLKIYGETCPQYLVLTAKDLEGLNMEGAMYVCSPPPRDERSQKACWAGLQQHVFSLFSSDHCPFRYDDAQGKLNPKGRTSFRWVPNGIPGVETRLPILFSEGVKKGRISLNEFVAFTATNHAKTYGLYPKKGTIAVGSDADIAIWDPERKETISQKLLHHGSDYTPYEGIAVTGWPVSTMVRGRFVVRDGKLVGAKSGGEYVPRAKSPYAAPSGKLPTEFSPAGRKSDSLMRWDREVDVLIFGAGMGGMTAALVASLEGLDVLLCEKTDQVGGTTSTSAGTVWIPGSSQAMRDGVPDSIDDARRFLAAEIGPRAETVRDAFLAAGPTALDYLEARSEVTFRAPPRHPDYHSNRPGRALAGRALAPLPFDGRLLGKDFDRVRPPITPFMVLGGMMVGKDDIPVLLKPFASWRAFMAAAKLLLRHATDRLRYTRGTRLVMGNALVARLFYSLKRRNVPIAFDAKLVELVRGNDRVEGAVVDIGDKRQTIRARRGVILATGGFAPDEKLRAEFMKDLPIAHSNAFAGANGDGFSAARAAGAAVDAKHTNPAFYFPSSLHEDIVFPHILLDRAKPGLIAVNKEGRRFVNELDSYHDFVEAMLRTNSAVPSVPTWLICDRSFIRDYGLGLVHPGAGRREIARYIADGYLHRAETLMELAQRIGVAGENLVRSVQEHNRYAETGVDDAFGKGGTEYNQFNGDPANKPNPCLRPIAEPPYFAVAVYPSTMGTCVGLSTDGDARVLYENGTPIEGLYAVGNDMASLFRGVYVGPGITLGPALVFAYRAVMHLASSASADAGEARKRISV